MSAWWTDPDDESRWSRATVVAAVVVLAVAVFGGWRIWGSGSTPLTREDRIIATFDRLVRAGAAPTSAGRFAERAVDSCDSSPDPQQRIHLMVLIDEASGTVGYDMLSGRAIEVGDIEEQACMPDDADRIIRARRAAQNM